jgi:hypothetical protein
LWTALCRARADCSPLALTVAEDAVFRYYLPMAASLAAGRATLAADREVVNQAVELRLAQAVLDWKGSDAMAFEGFATAMITAQLRQFPVERRVADLASVSPSTAQPPGDGGDTELWGMPW